jgi:hypothetical protein
MAAAPPTELKPQHVSLTPHAEKRARQAGFSPGDITRILATGTKSKARPGPDGAPQWWIRSSHALLLVSHDLKTVLTVQNARQKAAHLEEWERVTEEELSLAWGSMLGQFDPGTRAMTESITGINANDQATAKGKARARIAEVKAVTPESVALELDRFRTEVAGKTVVSREHVAEEWAGRAKAEGNKLLEVSRPCLSLLRQRAERAQKQS